MENIAHSAAVVFSDRRNCFEPSESIAKGTASSALELLAVILPFLRYALGELVELKSLESYRVK